MSIIFPRALEIAARSFANKPKVVGEVLVALSTGGRKMKLSEVQEYILAECLEEIKERARKRNQATERKRKQRGDK